MFKLTKRSFTALMALVLVFSMAAIFGCSQAENDNENDNDDQIFSTTPMVLGGLVLRADGTVWEIFRSGTPVGDDFDLTVAEQIKGLDNIVYITRNLESYFALRYDGTVLAWGNNELGTLGDGTTINSTYPIQIEGLSDIVAISFSALHSLALQSDGTVWSWGRNMVGQLGDGTTEDRSIPKPVEGLPTITHVATAWGSFALCENGSLWGWGFSFDVTPSSQFNMTLEPIEIPNLPPIKSLSVQESLILICEKGQVYSFEGGTDLSFSQWTGGYNNVAVLRGFTWLSLCDQGNVWSWDVHRHPTNFSIPPLIELREQLFESQNIVLVSMQGVIFLCEDGYVWRYRLSASSNAPALEKIEELSGIVALGSSFFGADVQFAFADDGTLWAWAKDDPSSDPIWDIDIGLTNTPQQVEFRGADGTGG